VIAVVAVLCLLGTAWVQGSGPDAISTVLEVGRRRDRDRDADRRLGHGSDRMLAGPR